MTRARATADSVPATKRERLEAKEAAIVEAARAVFIEHGFEGAKIAEIARRAGSADGTVYLYFKNKSDLMLAVVGRFWDELTQGARAAVAAEHGTFDKLRALALFHLRAIIADMPLIELAVMIKHFSEFRDGLVEDFKRDYVTVFDEAFRLGVDRGDIAAEASLWIARDLFFGALEYSARTILLHDRDAEDAVVDNLMRAFRATVGPDGGADAHAPDAEIEPLVARLEAAVAKLEKA